MYNKIKLKVQKTLKVHAFLPPYLFLCLLKNQYEMGIQVS